MSQEIYTITNLDGYASQIREAAAASLVDADTCSDNLDEFISLCQVKNLVKSECIGFDDNDRPLLDEDSNERIFDSVSIWIHNVALAQLAAKDLVECAWDNECNDMVFWAKTKEPNNVKSKPKRKNKRSEG